jgi:hypothetical protein
LISLPFTIAQTSAEGAVVLLHPPNRANAIANGNTLVRQCFEARSCLREMKDFDKGFPLKRLF